MPSWPEKISYKLKGAAKWPWADATVFDYTLTPSGRNAQRASVSYSFWLKGHIYSSIASWSEGSGDVTQFRKDDVIQIQYNPADPNQSYFPEQENLTAAFYGALVLIVIVIMAIGLVISNLR